MRTVGGNVTNAGTMTVSTDATFTGSFTNTGTLHSTGVSLSFSSLSLNDSTGYIVASAGDTYSITGDFASSSNQSNVWNTADARLAFAGSSSHDLSVTGANLGASGYAGNFAWLSLSLASGESLVLQDGNVNAGGAFYVRELNLADGLNQISLIHGNGLNIYYDPAFASNGYLGGQAYPLADGGQILPAVPEPGTAGMVMLTLGATGMLRRIRKAPRA